VGAWGPGPFDNDDALDFIGAFGETNPAAIEQRFLDVFDSVLNAGEGGGDDYIEVQVMSAAIAAAALVSAVNGGPVPESPAVEQWLERAPFAPDEDTVTQARRVFARAFEPENNEWYDLWSEGGSVDEVRAALDPYQRALAS
jgi:hypothetical protein